MSDPLQLSVDGHRLTFEQVPLHFITRGGIPDVFADYKEKTLRDTLRKKRYKNLVQAVEQRDLSDRDKNMPLGIFLLGLKQHGDSFYKEFLNNYGDKEYCKFAIQGDLAARKGLCCYTVDGEVRYIGRSRDPFTKRVNQGYGVIHPKNCYRDGQATNCHLNSLIAEETGEIEFWVCPLENNTEIIELEERLITAQSPRPEWNIALKNKQPEVQDPPSWVVPVRVTGAVVALLGALLVVASFRRSETPE